MLRKRIPWWHFNVEIGMLYTSFILRRLTILRVFALTRMSKFLKWKNRMHYIITPHHLLYVDVTLQKYCIAKLSKNKITFLQNICPIKQDSWVLSKNNHLFFCHFSFYDPIRISILALYNIIKKPNRSVFPF